MITWRQFCWGWKRLILDNTHRGEVLILQAKLQYSIVSGMGRSRFGVRFPRSGQAELRERAPPLDEGRPMH